MNQNHNCNLYLFQFDVALVDELWCFVLHTHKTYFKTIYSEALRLTKGGWRGLGVVIRFSQQICTDLKNGPDSLVAEYQKEVWQSTGGK